VAAFDPEAATDYLLVSTGSSDRSAAADIAAALDGVPQALSVASAYVDSTSITFGDYLGLLSKKDEAWTQAPRST
jgi:hypothetical protein